MRTSQLGDHQLSKFDKEHVTAERWQHVRTHIDRDFPGGRFSFVDLGGGNGRFADRVLDAYPNASGTVIDSSRLLLDKNVAVARKRIVLADALDVRKHCSGVDIVFYNWVLHHLVNTSSYSETRTNIRTALAGAADSLSERGRISIYESTYNGIVDGMPARLIFALTSSEAFAPITKRLGANTAGVGVCFLSHEQWRATFSDLGCKLESVHREEPWDWPAHRRLALLLRDVRHEHFWLSAG